MHLFVYHVAFILLQKVDGDFTSTNQGVVLLKNIPEGFEEKQIKGYFSQFGKITRLKLIRSKKVSFVS